MEDIKRLIGDPALDYAIESLEQVIVGLPKVQEKLKILETAVTSLALRAGDDETIPEDSYGYIPLDMSEFFDCMFDLENALANDVDFADSDLRHRRVDFVEAGCGPGRNLFVLRATNRFELRNVHGFDLSQKQIEHGRNVFGLGDSIQHGDCFDFDFAPYDVVYFYRPLANADRECEFEERLVSQVKPGTYIIGCGNLTFGDDRRLLAKCEASRLYKKLQ